MRHRQGSALALVAAALLMLQSFVTAWAAGAMPAAPVLDAFGNPLCVTSHDHEAAGPSGDHSGLVQCCIFGCNAATPVLAPPDAGAGLPRPQAHSDLRLRLRAQIRVHGREHDPGSPRAPPLTA